MFPGTAAAAIVLFSVIGLGLWLARPGWNLKPGRPRRYWALLFALLFASAIFASWFLAFFRIPIPYELTTLHLAKALPGLLLMTGAEELLFRQLMYRWLEKRQVQPRTIVLATAIAFACAHLGAVQTANPVGATFYLLQSAYMLWIGLLLGEIRRATASWLMAWLGHFAYNFAVLYALSSGLVA